MRLLTAALATVAFAGSSSLEWPLDGRAVSLSVRGFGGVHQSLLTSPEGHLMVAQEGPVMIDADVDLSEV